MRNAQLGLGVEVTLTELDLLGGIDQELTVARPEVVGAGAETVLREIFRWRQSSR
jgi:hypothetical protein